MNRQVDEREGHMERSEGMCVPLRLGNGVFFSRALLGRARLDRLKLVPWFLYRLPAHTRFRNVQQGTHMFLCNGVVKIAEI